MGTTDAPGTRQAPSFRIWPPVALGMPLVVGIAATIWWGDPVALPVALRWYGWVLLIAFVLWNGWGISLFARRGTGVMPGQPVTGLVTSGPWARSRNPLYVGLVTCYLALALIVPSFWALVLTPVGVAALEWGAIHPEEAFLRRRFGAAYDDYTRQVRRWL